MMNIFMKFMHYNFMLIKHDEINKNNTNFKVSNNDTDSQHIQAERKKKT